MTIRVEDVPATMGRAHSFWADVQAHAQTRRRRRWQTELLVTALAIATAVLSRIAIEQVVGGVAPFVLTFPVTIAATLLIGARAGILTAIGCQLLTINYVFPNWTVDHGGTPTDIANLLLISASLGVMIWIAHRYRRMSGRLRAQCACEVETLSLLIGEMDHRTKNNFQLAAALLDRQSRDVGSDLVSCELQRAAGRLNAIASVYRNLGIVSDRSGEVMIDAHLTDIVDLLRTGYLPPTVDLAFAGDALRVPAQMAMMIGLIVNEWVTNAVKYAFDARGGCITVEVRQQGNGLIVTVADDGITPVSPSVAGTGSRLIAGLARTIDADIRIDHGKGTRCRLIIPSRRHR